MYTKLISLSENHKMFALIFLQIGQWCPLNLSAFVGYRVWVNLSIHPIVFRFEVRCALCTIWTQHSKHRSWIQAGFDKFTHTYLCVRWKQKCFKGTVVNQSFPSEQEESHENTLKVSLKLVFCFRILKTWRRFTPS